MFLKPTLIHRHFYYCLADDLTKVFDLLLWKMMKNFEVVVPSYARLRPSSFQLVIEYRWILCDSYLTTLTAVFFFHLWRNENLIAVSSPLYPDLALSPYQTTVISMMTASS